MSGAAAAGTLTRGENQGRQMERRCGESFATLSVHASAHLHAVAYRANEQAMIACQDLSRPRPLDFQAEPDELPLDPPAD